MKKLSHTIKELEKIPLCRLGLILWDILLNFSRSGVLARSVSKVSNLMLLKTTLSSIDDSRKLFKLARYIALCGFKVARDLALVKELLIDGRLVRRLL